MQICDTLKKQLEFRHFSFNNFMRGQKYLLKIKNCKSHLRGQK